MPRQHVGEYDPTFPVLVKKAITAGGFTMTKDNNDNSGKWSDPTSSYSDAMAVKRLIKKVKEQNEQDRKDDDKASS